MDARLRYGVATAIGIGASIGGYMYGSGAWKAHPIVGGLIGFFVIGGIVGNISVALIAPDYKETIRSAVATTAGG